MSRRNHHSSRHDLQQDRQQFGPISPPDDPPSHEPDHEQEEQSEYAAATRAERDRMNEHAALRPVMKFTQAAYHKIMQDLSEERFQLEQGGILLGPEDSQDLVVRYVKDTQGDSRPASFTIDDHSLNREIKKVRDAGLSCVGIIHSHPPGCTRPSYGDLEFLRRIFSDPKNGGGWFLFPIVCGQQLYPYLIDTQDVRRIQFADLVLV